MTQAPASTKMRQAAVAAGRVLATSESFREMQRRLDRERSARIAAGAHTRGDVAAVVGQKRSRDVLPSGGLVLRPHFDRDDDAQHNGRDGSRLDGSGGSVSTGYAMNGDAFGFGVTPPVTHSSTSATMITNEGTTSSQPTATQQPQPRVLQPPAPTLLLPSRAPYLLEELKSCVTAAQEEFHCIQDLESASVGESIGKSCLNAAFGLQPKSSPVVLAAVEVGKLASEMVDVLKNCAHGSTNLAKQVMDVIGSVSVALWWEVAVCDAMEHKQTQFDAAEKAAINVNNNSPVVTSDAVPSSTTSLGVPNPPARSTRVEDYDLRQPHELLVLLGVLAADTGASSQRNTELDTTLMALDEADITRKATRSRITALARVRVCVLLSLCGIG